MNLILTAAKPYAKAIFELALAKNQLTEWLRTLKTLANFTFEVEKNISLDNPKIDFAQKMEIFCDFTNKSRELKSFIRLLVERKKLNLLPDIVTSYQQLFFAHKKILKVKVSSAEKLSASHKQQFLNKFKTRYQSKILLECCTDATLIGGATIHLGDEVIDASIKGTLLRLKQNLLTKNTYVKTK